MQFYVHIAAKENMHYKRLHLAWSNVVFLKFAL